MRWSCSQSTIAPLEISAQLSFSLKSRLCACGGNSIRLPAALRLQRQAQKCGWKHHTMLPLPYSSNDHSTIYQPLLQNSSIQLIQSPIVYSAFFNPWLLDSISINPSPSLFRNHGRPNTTPVGPSPKAPRGPVCVPVAREKNQTRFGSKGSTSRKAVISWQVRCLRKSSRNKEDEKPWKLFSKRTKNSLKTTQLIQCHKKKLCALSDLFQPLPYPHTKKNHLIISSFHPPTWNQLLSAMSGTASRNLKEPNA